MFKSSQLCQNSNSPKKNKDIVSLSPPTGRQHYNYQFSDLGYSKCLRLHCSVEELSSPEEDPGLVITIQSKRKTDACLNCAEIQTFINIIIVYM